MNSLLLWLDRWRCLVVWAAILTPTLARGFPPAPHHRIYGIVRDEYGQPLTAANATIVFESLQGVRLETPVNPQLEPGSNYALNVPMDSGIAPDTYKPTALQPTLPFRIQVKIGTTTYLPIEMTGTYSLLGRAAGSTRIDLTLGVDSDGDGLPDAWEQWLISQLGTGDLRSIRPGDDADGDGISNRDEYLAGTFAFDPAGGFQLSLVPRTDGPPLLEFMTVPPRTYTVLAATSVDHWVPIAFRIAEEGPTGSPRINLRATDVHVVRVEPVLPAEWDAALCFFRVLAQ